MDSTIQEAIDLIERKIRELQRAKLALIQASREKPIETETNVFPSVRRRKIRKKKGTRKLAVVKLIRENGPLTRKEIFEKTGFPIGTVAYVLNDKSIFFAKEGKWDLVESKDRKEEKAGVSLETSKTPQDTGGVGEGFKRAGL